MECAAPEVVIILILIVYILINNYITHLLRETLKEVTCSERQFSDNSGMYAQVYCLSLVTAADRTCFVCQHIWLENVFVFTIQAIDTRIIYYDM